MNKFKARVILALSFMKESVKNALAFVLPISFAFICFSVSVSVMNGQEDCSLPVGVDSFSMPLVPGSCADSKTVFTRDVFFVLGIIFILAQIGIVFIMNRRNEQTEENDMKSIKIPNNNR